MLALVHLCIQVGLGSFNKFELNTNLHMCSLHIHQRVLVGGQMEQPVLGREGGFPIPEANRKCNLISTYDKNSLEITVLEIRRNLGLGQV